MGKPIFGLVEKRISALCDTDDLEGNPLKDIIPFKNISDMKSILICRTKDNGNSAILQIVVIRFSKASSLFNLQREKVKERFENLDGLCRNDLFALDFIIGVP